LHECVVYIDLNMVRAGVVKHPRECKTQVGSGLYLCC
jgi:hypothetical protein